MMRGFFPFFMAHCLSLFLLFTGFGSATVYKVGSDVKITCLKQYNGGYTYAPTFEVKLASEASEASFTTLFTGRTPRPHTDSSRWRVSWNETGIVYTLLDAQLADAGVYRCYNFKDDYYPVTIVGSEMACPDPASRVHYTEGQFLSKSCRIAKVGSDPIRLSWSTSTDRPLEHGLSTDELAVVSDEESSSLKAKLVLKLYPMHDEATFRCHLVGTDDDKLDDLKCSIGPLDVQYAVRDASPGEAGVEDVKDDFKVVKLIGNPPPEEEKIQVDCGLAVCSYVYSTYTGEVEVAIKITTIPESRDSASVNVSYDGKVVKRLRFLQTSATQDESQSWWTDFIKGLLSMWD